MRFHVQTLTSTIAILGAAACGTGNRSPGGPTSDAGSSTSGAGGSASSAGGSTSSVGGSTSGTGGAPDAGLPDAGNLSTLGTMATGWAANEWHEIVTAPLQSVFLSHAQEDAIDPNLWQVTGPAGALSLWGSGAFDGQKLYVGDAGGHGGYNGNELYAYDFTSLSWSRLYDPSPVHGCVASGAGHDCVPNWGPQALHQYDMVVHSKKANELLQLGGPGGSLCWAWPLANADPKTGWKSFPCPSNMQYNYMHTAEDPLTGDIIVFGAGSTGFSALDPVSLTYSRVSNNEATYGEEEVVADIDPVRRRLFVIGAHSGGPDYGKFCVESVDIDADPIAVASDSSSQPPTEMTTGACFIHHAKSGKMLGWIGDQRLWSYDPDADAWASVPTTGVTPTSSHPNGPYQRCAYLPEVDLFVGYNDETRGMFAIRAAL